MVAVGDVDGPLRMSCTEEGVESAALVRLPLKVAVSVDLVTPAGVKDAVRAQTPPTASEEGRLPLNVQSEDAVAVRL
jgi:hypothetical protein